MTETTGRSRLSLPAAAWVVARRDFVAILFSRAFLFFLLGPLFPVLAAVVAGGIGARVEASTGQAEIGIAMAPADVDLMLRAREALEPRLDLDLPKMVVLKRLAPGETFDAKAVLSGQAGAIGAVLTGTPAHPRLIAPAERLARWQGAVALIAANALQKTEVQYPKIQTTTVATSGASERVGRMRTAQAAQTLLFIVTIFLAGMVLSTLVEEKANKIIEALAAAIPMDALFFGKLFAMFLVSMVGVVVWAAVIGGLVGFASLNSSMIGGINLSSLPEPGVGWPLFFAFAVVYFTMNYLLLGSVYLTIGSMAATVREVQTLSMPATLAQVVVFYFAIFALTDIDGPTELAAIAFPLSSPYAMLARAAVQESLWPHLLAIGWQALWVVLFIRGGASLFRRRVMKSGPQRVKRKGRFDRRTGPKVAKSASGGL